MTNFKFIPVIALLFFISCSDQQEIFVATSGDDLNPGTKNKPVATLEQAKKLAREVKLKHQKKSVKIWLRGGTYNLTESLQFNEKDSGSEPGPIIYSAFPGENVSIRGGLDIPVDQITSITDKELPGLFPPEVRKQIKQVNLKELGINDYGKIRNFGFARPYGPAWMEVFVNKKPLHLSRWPNEGYLPMGKVIDPGSIPRDKDFSNRGGVFTYEENRPSTWKYSHDIWLSGYFMHGWAEEAVHLSKIDTIGKTFSTRGPSLYGFGPASGKPYRRWYAFNILEEIDEPGEYYIDRDQGILYFIPPGKIETLEVSMLQKPLISLTGASNIHFNNMILECSRGMGIYMDNTQNNRIEDCTFRNLGIVAVCIGKGIKPFKKLTHNGTGEPASGIIGSLQQHMYDNTTFNREGGKNNKIVNCTIYQMGAGGISLGGGDRLSLDPAGNFVENCKIYDFNRIEKSYRAGIDISGVGNRISHCEIFDAPSMAILLHGNDHLIEYNEIHHVCHTVDDQGALYYGRDPSERGHQVNFNYFHNNGTSFEYTGNYHGTSAVYHDDGACGMKVFGNVFYKAGTRNVLIGGGSDNPYTNNIFMDCQIAIHVDNRNQRGSSSSTSPGGIYEKRLNAVHYDQPPYSQRYPHLANYFEDDPALPKRNRVSKNLFYKVKKVINGNPEWLPFEDDNWIADEDPGFINYGEMDFTLKPEAEVFKKIPGFEAIPFDKMGIINKQ